MMRSLRLFSSLKKDKRGLIFLDLTVSLTVIWFLIWIFGGIIGTLAQNTREVALRYQLNNFRMLLESKYCDLTL